MWGDYIMQYDAYSWQLNYMETFQCDGAKCNAKCCRKWDIEIDDAAYRKYQQMANLQDREKILACVTLDSEQRKRIIKFNEQGICPLLCDDYLCYIQRNYGADALSDTCQLYPRMLVRCGSYRLQTLSMTCPLAADEALFGLGSMGLKRAAGKGSGYNTAWNNALQDDSVKDDALGSMMESVVLGAAMLLKDQAKPRDTRIFLLGLFLDKVDELKEFDNGDELISDLAIKYQTAEIQQQLQSFMDSLSFNGSEHKRLFKEFVAALAKEADLQDIKEFLHLPDGYYTEYGNWRKAVDAEYGAAIDNLWLQEFLYQGYPCRLAGDCVHNYLVYLLSYALWDVIWFNFYHKNNGRIDKAEFIGLVGKFCTIMDHKIDFLGMLEKYVKDYESNAVCFMQMMLHL